MARGLRRVALAGLLCGCARLHGGEPALPAAPPSEHDLWRTAESQHLPIDFRRAAALSLGRMALEEDDWYCADQIMEVAASDPSPELASARILRLHHATWTIIADTTACGRTAARCDQLHADQRLELARECCAGRINECGGQAAFAFACFTVMADAGESGVAETLSQAMLASAKPGDQARTERLLHTLGLRKALHPE